MPETGTERPTLERLLQAIGRETGLTARVSNGSPDSPGKLRFVPMLWRRSMPPGRPSNLRSKLHMQSGVGVPAAHRSCSARRVIL